MIKKLLIILLALMFTGCSSSINSPTSTVESFFYKYQINEEEIMMQLDNSLKDEKFLNDKLKTNYKTIMKRQYQDLRYNITDEQINGKHAIVMIELEVYDYKNAMNEADDYLIINKQDFSDDLGNINYEKFMNYKMEKMKNIKDRIKYTIELHLTEVNEKWEIDNIDESIRQKIHGIYNE